MSKREQAVQKQDYEFLMQNFVEPINTWEEYYEYLDNCMNSVATTMHPIVMIDTMTTMHSMFTAMRELPEEGDIKVLLERAVHNMVYGARASGVPRLLSGLSRDLDRRLEVITMEIEHAVSGTDTSNVHILH